MEQIRETHTVVAQSDCFMVYKFTDAIWQGRFGEFARCVHIIDSA
jgi:hypothetical protein